LSPWMAGSVTCTQKSGVFPPKGNREIFLSCLFSGTLTVWHLVLRGGKRAIERPSGHGQGRPGSKLTEVRYREVITFVTPYIWPLFLFWALHSSTHFSQSWKFTRTSCHIHRFNVRSKLPDPFGNNGPILSQTHRG
jgi:hypothetical protein